MSAPGALTECLRRLGEEIEKTDRLLALNAEYQKQLDALTNQVNYAYASNRELVFELSIRDSVISDLQTRLAEHEDRNT